MPRQVDSASQAALQSSSVKTFMGLLAARFAAGSKLMAL